MAKDFIARLLADTSGFDPQVGKSMRFVTEFYRSIDDLNSGMAGLSEQQKSLLLNIGKMPASTKSAEVAISQLDYVCKTLEKSYGKMSDNLKKTDWAQSIGRSVTELQGRIAALKSEMASTPKKAYISPVTTFDTSGVAAASNAVAAAGGSKGVFKGILGGNLAARAVMDSLRFLKDTVKDAVEANMEFEYSQATLAAVLGQSKEQIMDLTIQAQKLGSTSLYSAKEISELQVVLARLGFNKQEIEDSTDAIAKLALATGVSLEHAASLTGATLRAFGYDTKEAARVASVLGVSTTKSALDMEKLKTAMSYASSVARQAGFEIEDVVAMLGKMVDNGQQATTAGVNMRNIMLDLSNKSSKLSRAIKEVTGKDQVRNFDEFVDALRQLRDAGINLDDVANVVQKRVTPGFLNMIANTDGIAQLRDELKGCTGELDNMASKMEDTLSGATKKMHNAWNGLMLSFQESTGTIKTLVQWLTKLINETNKAWASKSGTDAYVNSFRNGGSAAGADELLGNYGKKKFRDNEILSKLDYEIKDGNKKADEAYKLLDEYMKWAGKGYHGKELLSAVNTLNAAGFKDAESAAKYIASWRDYSDTRQIAYDRIANKGVVVGKNGSIADNEGVDTATKLRLEQARKREADAISAYAESTKIAAMEREQGKIDEKQYNNEMYNATERLYKVYADLAGEFDNPKYKEALDKWWQEMEKFAKAIGELKDKSIQGAMNTLNHRDTRLLRGLQSTAKTAGVSYESVGLYDLGARVMNGETIDDSAFQSVADKLNAVLGKQKYYIAIDFETGSIQKIQKEIFSLGDAVGALQNLSSGFQSLKTSTQDLAETLQGDADGFDKMFAVIDYGLGILQTFVSIQKAIDVLSKMAIVTKQAETAATIEDTTASMANAAAKGAEASAAGAAAAAEGGKAVAGIPIAGPILAVAAIAAIAGALAAAFSKTEYHAGGGMVGMNGMRPLGTDVVPAMLTPGEIVLNRAQQSNIANQLQGVGMRTQTIIVKGEVSGRALRMVMDNDNRAQGGTRGLYARTH